MPDRDTYAFYVRASTKKQTDQHQVDEIHNWLHDRGENPNNDNVRRYADFGVSGSKSDREDFQRLLDDIENGEIDILVAWELSRITRDGEDLQQFLNLCEDHGVHIYFTSDNIDDLPPDGSGRFIADIIGAVYQQERRSLIRRIKAGTKRAREEGKWLGQVPTGFERDDEGYLAPNLDPDHDAGETGFFEMQWALEEIETGKSFRAAANDTPNVTRQTLSNVYNDDERREWYLNPENVETDRVQEAVNDIPNPANTSHAENS